MTVNKDNFKAIFTKAMRAGEKAIAEVMAAWLWATQNKKIAGAEWIEKAETEIRRVFGIRPAIFASLTNKFGKGDMALGAEVLKKIGVGEVQAAQATLGVRGFNALADRAAEIEASEFHAEVDKEERRIKAAASRMSDRANAKANERAADAQGYKTPEEKLRGENRRLRLELAAAKRELAEKDACIAKQKAAAKRELAEKDAYIAKQKAALKAQRALF